MAEVTGVLLMAYGTPDSLEDVEAYYTHIRHGHKPSEEQLAELRERYSLVGGHTPLSEISEATRLRLEQRLNEAGDESYRVVLGMKHWRPWIREAVQQLNDEGTQQAVGLVLAPHYSTMSIADYERYVRQAQDELGSNIQLEMVRSWHLHPGYLRAVARRIRQRLRELGGTEDVTVIFTAHSLPARILQQDDPYPQQLRETSEALAQHLGLANWTFSYQSAGRTAEPWLGPDLVETVDALADSGAKQILAAPIGFVSDHLEILYDIDHEARSVAEERGVKLVRTESLNASEDFVNALADIVRSAANAFNVGV